MFWTFLIVDKLISFRFLFLRTWANCFKKNFQRIFWRKKSISWRTIRTFINMFSSWIFFLSSISFLNSNNFFTILITFIFIIMFYIFVCCCKQTRAISILNNLYIKRILTFFCFSLSKHILFRSLKWMKSLSINFKIFEQFSIWWSNWWQS